MSESTEATEPRYTLAEARSELRRRECSRSGHDFSFVTTIDGQPRSIHCAGCGWSGAVTMGERP